MLPCLSFLFGRTENIPLIDGEWCTRCVLPRDFTIKTVDEFMHRSALDRGGTCWRIFIHMQHFRCWPVLLFLMEIVLAMVCFRNLDKVHCFGTIFRNQPCHVQLSGCRGGCRSVDPHGEHPKTALQLWIREVTWYLYTRGMRGRMSAK